MTYQVEEKIKEYIKEANANNFMAYYEEKLIIQPRGVVFIIWLVLPTILLSGLGFMLFFIGFDLIICLIFLIILFGAIFMMSKKTIIDSQAAEIRQFVFGYCRFKIPFSSIHQVSFRPKRYTYKGLRIIVYCPKVIYEEQKEIYLWKECNYLEVIHFINVIHLLIFRQEKDDFLPQVNISDFDDW